MAGNKQHSIARRRATSLKAWRTRKRMQLARQIQQKSILASVALHENTNKPLELPNPWLEINKRK